MPYLISCKKGKDVQVLGVGTLYCGAEDIRSEVALVKDGELTHDHVYRKLEPTAVVFPEDFDRLKDSRGGTVTQFRELVEHATMVLVTKKGDEFMLIALASGSYSK